MNARIKASAVASNREKERARELVAEEMRRQGGAYSRRMFKLFCYSLNNRYGFGKQRLSEVIGDVENMSVQHKKDEAFWQHLDKRMEQIGMPFAKENYEEMDR